MTMPYGSVEEPTVLFELGPSGPARVVSSDQAPTKSVGTEFGNFRTILVNSTLGPQRICSRSPRRKRLLISVAQTTPANPVGGQAGPVTGVAAAPAAGTTIASIAGTTLDAIFPAGGLWLVQWSTELQGPVADPADRNNMQLTSPLGNSKAVALQTAQVGVVPQAPVLVARNPGNGINVQAIGNATAATTYGAELEATLSAQPSTDGVILGSREFCNNSDQIKNPFIAGLGGGGFIQVGDAFRWECQAELWCAFPPSNIAPVLVTVCDEQYASD